MVAQSQYGIKLAVHLITKHFGNLVAKVCETLLRKGPLTLQLLLRFTELNPSQAKNSLLILIQHNCVQAYAAERDADDFGGAPKVDIKYLALFDNILHRLRFAKYIAIVSEKLDKDDSEMFKGLLENGRLTLKQMVDRAQSIANKDEKVPPTPNAILDGLLKLLTARFVERCPVPEPVIQGEVKEDAPARKRGPKSAKLTEVETLEQRVVAAARPMEVKRFSMLEPDVDEEKTGQSKTEQSSPVCPGEKRKHDALESDGESWAADETLWRANFEEFTRYLRHKACIEHVRSWLDDGAAVVLGAILDASKREETIIKTETSIPMSLNTIFEEVIKTEAGRSMTLDRVRASLSALGCSGDDYRIDLRKILEQAKNEEVESTVLKRYGRDAYRMFRLLSKDDRLVETDKIADSTFVEKKEAPKTLFKLWKDEYLQMEKATVSGPRQSQLLLWKVNKHVLWEHYLDEMHHAALNLGLRTNYLVDQNEEILNVPREKRTEELQQKINQCKKVMILLESSLFRLDEALMLFHDF